MSLNYKPVVSQQTFFVAEFMCHEDSETGKCTTVPKVPITFCPIGSDKCGEHKHCKVTILRERKRKQPRNLTVLDAHCETHSLFFTIYPIGYTPYGRQPLVELDRSGNEIDHEKSSSEPPQSLETYSVHMASAELSAEVSSTGKESANSNDEVAISDGERPLIPTFFLQSCVSAKG
jgi:hypothetical protein